MFGAQVEVEDYLNAKIIRPFTRLPDAEDDSALPVSVHRSGVISPIVLVKTEPEYSEAARLAGLEGTVVLKAVVAEDRSAQQIRVIRPLGLGLDDNALEAVRAWRFAPGRCQAPPALVEMDLAVDFFLQSRESRRHVAGVAFHSSEGVSEPVFGHVEYPAGAGVARSAIDDGRLVNAMGRLACSEAYVGH